jgi:ornithine carbamoyltransferase
MKISVATPKNYEPHTDILNFAKKFGPAFSLINSPEEAAQNADVLVTDVWASMGQEEEAKQRMKDFSGFQINEKIISLAHQKAIVLHCLPAHRGEEITADIFEKNAAPIFDEAENRLHAQKAVMALLMG